MTGNETGAPPSLTSATTTGLQPDVSVVLPLIGPAAGLEDTWSSLQASVGLTLEVVVVSASPTELPDIGAPTRHVHAPSHCSEAVLLNLGLLAARGRAVTFVSPGDRFGARVLARMVGRVEEDTVVVAAFSPATRLDQLAGAGLAMARAGSVRRGRFRDGLGRRKQLGFWLEVVGRPDVSIEVIDARGARPAPQVDGSWWEQLDEDLEVLAQLEASFGRAQWPGSLGHLVSQARSWVGRSINAGVRAEPERHPAVVDAVRARGLVHFPWADVNHGVARDLAILQLFPPLLDTSSLVAARRLRGWGRVTDVVSMDPGRQRTDPTALSLAGELVDEHRMVRRRALPVWPSVVAFTDEVLAAVTAMEDTKGPHRSMYSRAMFVHSHFAAAALKLRRPHLRWVAEFSDPLSVNPYGEQRVLDVGHDWLGETLGAVLTAVGYDVSSQRRLFEWCELLPYALADEILYTNDQQREVMLDYCPVPELAERARLRSRVEHHPVPAPELYHRVRSAYSLEPGVVNIGYFGNFYLTRGLGEVVQAIGGLHLAERDRVRLHIFTADPAPVVARMIERGVADVVRVVPMSGYLEYLNAATRFDVLLLGDYETKPQFAVNPYLPAKLADYLGSGRRIWGVCEPGSVLSRTDLAYRSELGDTMSAAAVLRRIIADGV